MVVNTNHQSDTNPKNRKSIHNDHFVIVQSQNNNSINSSKKSLKKTDRDFKSSQNIPKLVQTQFAQFLNNLLEYSSELTYFAINAFQTSSLRRVQINTLVCSCLPRSSDFIKINEMKISIIYDLICRPGQGNNNFRFLHDSKLQRFTNYCVPRVCAFYYNLDTEFDNFVQKMRLLCALAKRTFLDMRIARIHFSEGRMMSLPITRRSIDIFKCNINRLRDLKQIHQDIGYDLLLPNDQLYLTLDLLVTDFELLNCELDAEVKFADAMILQTIIKDIFLQFRIALTWIYPAVKYAAYRPGDPNIQQEVKKCDQLLGIPHSDDFCGKQKKSSKSNINELVKNSSSTHIQLLERMTNPTRNTNQNFAIQTISDCSLKIRKKSSIKISVTTTANDDFNRYLCEKKLHDIGRINFQTNKSNKNIPALFELNQNVSR